MKLNCIKSALLTVTCLLLLTSCSKNSDDKNRLKVTAVNFPCYDFARAVTGMENEYDIDLQMLIRPGTEIHSYDPSPADIIRIQSSALFIYIGGESDEWVERILSGIPEENRPVTLKLIDYAETVQELNIEEDEEEEEADEHVWTSPENAVKMMEACLEAFCGLTEDDSEKEYFRKNASAYCNGINETADSIRKVLSEASQKFIVMADRFPLRYFADSYGLDYKAAFSGCSTAVEASLATVADLIRTVQEKELPAVFHIELSTHKLADVIAEATGTQIIELHSIQNISRTDFENGETWISLMKRNEEALRKGLPR